VRPSGQNRNKQDATCKDSLGVPSVFCFWFSSRHRKHSDKTISCPHIYLRTVLPRVHVLPILANEHFSRSQGFFAYAESLSLWPISQWWEMPGHQNVSSTIKSNMSTAFLTASVNPPSVVPISIQRDRGTKRPGWQVPSLALRSPQPQTGSRCGPQDVPTT